MIPFSAEDPFPILPIGSYSYVDAKAHAQLVDQFLGFQMELTEKQISPAEGQENWQHLDAQAFQTPYVELRTTLELLNLPQGSLIVDLGCGYGRMAHVIGRYYQHLNFLGYELESLRVTEALRVLSSYGYPNTQVLRADLLLLKPEPASCYFLYDFGTNAAIEKTLNDLREISKSGPIQVVARGRASRFLIHRDHPWLYEINPPRHFETFSIFQS